MNHKSIQILRGSTTYDPAASTEILLDGQPFYSKKTNQLYIGDGKSELKQLKGTAIGLNIVNGTGIDSIIQKYSGEIDSTHFDSIVTGENAAAFGEAHLIEGNRTVHFGKMNNSTSANALIVGLGNGRGTGVNPTLEPISGNNIIVCGNNNQNIGAHGSIIFGSMSINKGAQSLVGGQNIINEGACSLVISYAANGQTAENHASAAWLGGDSSYIGPNGSGSLVHGQKLICNYGQQKIFGRFNANKSNTLLEIGNGGQQWQNKNNLSEIITAAEYYKLSADERKNYEAVRRNAFEVLTDGRAKVFGKPAVDNDVVRLQDIVYTSVEDIKLVVWG